MNPEADPSGAGYHIRQSQIAIGSGGLFGKGFLNGTQSHLQYLPENHTDFIFATMAEEWGLLGGVLIIVAYALVIKWGIGVALEAKDRFSRLTAAGLTTTIFFYVAINLMMVMGLAPVVGIPLPLVSYGGSAMLTVMLCLGGLMAIERSARKR
ncbi:MAG: rod shape determining protein RodA [Sphingomonadales bacterium]|nr:rod shape determining protein RodA [Sphingomonadales bacterium]